MTKQERLQRNEIYLNQLSQRSDSINSLISQVEHFIRAYWDQIRYVWSCGKMQTCEEYFPWSKNYELKDLNRQYKLLLKLN